MKIDEKGVTFKIPECELQEILGNEDAILYQKVFNLQEDGNWHEGRQHKTNIPHLTSDLPTLSRQVNLTKQQLSDRLSVIRKK